jgi:uncharacterized protein DUF6790
MKQKLSFYLIVVLLLMLVFPLLSIAIENGFYRVPLSWDLVGKWFVFWVVGVRLFTAGIRQVLKPAFTAQEIFHIKNEESFVLVKELGFANICMGLVGLLSILKSGWCPLAAIGGGLYFGFAGIEHIIKKPVSTNETIAMISDLLFFALMAIYLVCTFCCARQ